MEKSTYSLFVRIAAKIQLRETDPEYSKFLHE